MAFQHFWSQCTNSSTLSLLDTMVLTLVIIPDYHNYFHLIHAVPALFSLVFVTPSSSSLSVDLWLVCVNKTLLYQLVTGIKYLAFQQKYTGQVSMSSIRLLLLVTQSFHS